YLLRGMVVCQLCGRKLVGDKTTNRSGTYTYYRCNGDRGVVQQVNGRRAEERVWAWVMERLTNPDLIIRMLQSDDEAEQASRRRDEADMHALLALRADYERKENNLIDLYTDGGITLDKFRERKTALDALVEGNEARIGEIEERARQRQ